MSRKDMFRKEQRFSFRKFSFGLASAVIANVIFGGAIANSPVVHANTVTETTAVNAGETGPAQSNQRSVSLSYVVNLVDQAGQAISVQTKTLEVTSDQATATATADLAADLVPAGYTAVSGLGQVTLTENAENVFTVVVEKVAAATENPAAASTGTEVKPEAVNQEQATPADKTNLEQLISETSLLIPEGEKQAKDNAELTTAVQAAKPVLEAAQAVFADAAATAEQVAAQEAALRAANKAIGDQLALLSEDGTVSVSLNVNNTNGRTDLNIRTDYTVSWTNASVDRTATNPATNANYRPDAGLSWVTDANGNKALVYKYNMSNPTAFTSEDILKLLTATPTDPAQRTLLGTEKEKIEAGRDGYAKQGQAYTLNGANIQALDITDTDHGWGGRTANDTKVRDLSDTERTQFTISATNGVGELTVTANGDEKFLSYSKLMLVNTNMPVSNQAISGNYVNNTTQTNLYNVYLVGYKEVDMPTIGVNPNVKPNNNDSRKLEVLHVFGNVTGTTEAVSTSGSATAPDFDTTEATKAFPVTNPEKETVTLTYGVPGNITAYEAGNPDSLTTNGHPPMSAETGDIGKEHSNQLRLDAEGKLTGELPLNPGGFYSRIIKVTDSAGNVLSYSNPFYVITYTDKRADNTDLTVAAASDLTEANIFGKLTIDTVDGSVNPALTVPTSEYTRTIVGYRTVTRRENAPETKGPTENLSASTLNTLPAGQIYEIKVATTNPYGQTIYNWVPVNDTRTAGTDKKPLYAFNNTPIATVGAGTDEADNVNKVNVVTLNDPNGINSVVISRESNTTPGSFSPAPIGITIDSDGNASGTPAVGAIGVYSRGLTVIDGTWATENLFPRNNEMQFYILDATAGATITKAVGGSVTEQEILDNVDIKKGNSNTLDSAIDTRYRKVLAPGETVPTAPGEYDVKVRVITSSNVYKDVVVKVIIDKYADTLTATAAENTSLVPGSGTAATQPIVINDANGAATTAPAGTTYAIDPAFKAEKEALGYEISVSPTGEVSVKAPAGQESDITVPVTVTYPDKTTDSVSVPFKVNQKDTAQLKAKEAIDEKLADETKALEDKKNAEIAAITNNPDLTQEQKDAAVQDITDAAKIAQDALTEKANEAKTAVDNATTPEEAKAAQTAGETTLADLENGAEAALDLITAKAEAKDAIADKLADEVKELEAKQAEAEKAIDASTMTPEEKAAAKEALQDVVDAEKAKLEDAAKKATDAVDAATTPADVKAAEIAGETALTE
ncbi:TPA: YPDG domain-containing protein, partial [Streptococcus suis]